MDTDESQYGKPQYRSVVHIEKRIFNSLLYYYINKLQMSIGCDKNHTFPSSKFHLTKTKVKQFC